MALVDNRKWVEKASCSSPSVDPEIFYPPPDAGLQANDPAKAVCKYCEVKAECLAYALDYDEQHGVWGGLSVQERAAIRHRDTGGYCKWGHPRTPENMVFSARGHLSCLICRRRHQRDKRARERQRKAEHGQG